MGERQDATAHTRAVIEAGAADLPWEDRQDFEDATRGFIAPLGDASHIDGFPLPVWDDDAFGFITDDAPCPDTVHPSLWRQSQLCRKGGLFEVTDRMYQVRNADISNLTIVEGDTGLIVFDPLISTEPAAAAMELYYAHRPRRPVVAVLYSHSHIDHYGGVKGVVSADDVEAGRVRVIAPEGFLDAAISENVLAGTIMSRRAMYMYGILLPRDPKGNVGIGLGMATSRGTSTLIPPTETITETGQTLDIDGLTFEFLLAPDTEAPSEMHWFIPELGALTAAENCCHTLHNTYTIRGAPIRDPRAWARYLDETIERWGDRTEVLYGMHHWPTWGRERAIETLRKGRSVYTYINDETLRLANHGHTPVEIAEEVRLPDSLQRHWAARGYYGTVDHNVKATYVKYLGAYDANPAHLHPLPPVEAATRYLEVMGGADAVLAHARDAHERGEYRWVAQLLDHVVFAEPTNQPARDLLADALEQMGYASESATWRNAYLMGAQELRDGSPDFGGLGGSTASPDMVRTMPLDLVFSYLAVRLDGARAGDVHLRLRIEVTDTGETAWCEVVDGGLIGRVGGAALPEVDATVTLTRPVLDRFVLGESTIDDELHAGSITCHPDDAPLRGLFDLLDTFSVWVPIIEP